MSSEKNHNLYTTFWQHASVDPQSPLLGTGGGNVYTYADAEELSSQLANYLTDLGLSAGDRVTTQVEKSPEALWLYLACLKAGLVFHPLNTAYQASELEYFLNDARPAVVVCDSRNEALMASLVSKENAPVIRTLNADGSGTLTDDSLDCEKQFTPVTSAADDLAALLYSSGTTGRPKGIMLSHANLAQNTLALCSAWEFNANDRLLHALPIFHVHGLFVGIGCVLMSGASMHWLPRFDIDDVLRFLPQCSVMMGVPTYYSRLLARSDFGREPCARMRLFISGSAPLPEATFHEFQQRTGHTILERYGMTETGMNTSNPLQGERKAGTVGKALPGVTVRVVDNAGNELPRGEPGNVQVKGANVFKGYWQMPEKTAGDFSADGFFNTGDKGVFDSDGYLSLIGRAKDMIISGGLNIYPKEIEQLLDRQPQIVESAIIGVPHADFGEAVVAVIVRSENDGDSLSELDVIADLKNQLAGFKVPKRVFFVDELPRNTMGKVQKNALRQRYAYCCQTVNGQV